MTIGNFMKKRTRDLIIGSGLMAVGAGALVIAANHDSSLPVERAKAQSKDQLVYETPTSPQQQNQQPTRRIEGNGYQITNKGELNDRQNHVIDNINDANQKIRQNNNISGEYGPAYKGNQNNRPTNYQATNQPTSQNPQNNRQNQSSVSGNICAPEALAVGIKHFRYAEAPASELVWSGYGSQSDAKYKIRRSAKPALQELVNAAKRDGVTLTPGSIFRGVARQRQIVNNKRSQGQSAKQIYYTSSHPDFSEHHTGLAVDFSPINNGFAKTAGYRWLLANAGRYGWEQTFTPDYSRYSGVSEESWHWRYVGKNGENAPIFAASKNRAC